MGAMTNDSSSTIYGTEMNENQHKPKIADAIKAGLLDDILAQIDAAYANYKQTPVFTCQEEELAYWSRTAPADNNEIVFDSIPEKPAQ